MDKGVIYLIPCPLGSDNPLENLPLHTLNVVRKLNTFVVENAKSARHFVRDCEHPKAIRELHFDILDKKTDSLLIPDIIEPCLSGENIGVISEAGCPGIADPGSTLINYAHLKKIKVIPLIGPSSILQALMASGFNGQKFAFHGYLPKNNEDLKRKIKSFEKHIRDYKQTQIFIETPYRTDHLLHNIINFTSKNMKLCIAANINQLDEKIITKTISAWEKNLPVFGKTPAVFLLYF